MVSVKANGFLFVRSGDQILHLFIFIMFNNFKPLYKDSVLVVQFLFRSRKINFNKRTEKFFEVYKLMDFYIKKIKCPKRENHYLLILGIKKWFKNGREKMYKNININLYAFLGVKVQ